jgi:hypothetical protein
MNKSEVFLIRSTDRSNLLIWKKKKNDPNFDPKIDWKLK